MIRKALLLKIFSAVYLQRWNDKIRPVDLTEMDKQGHKMIIAYFLGKFAEDAPSFDWLEIVEGGLFEFLQRIVLTDIKPPVFYRIKENRAKYDQLNDWVYEKLEPTLAPLPGDLLTRFRSYFRSDELTLNRRILSAAHFHASKWEFDILERINPHGFEMEKIRSHLEAKQSELSDLRGIQALEKNASHRSFIDLCGQLRFQIRWANVYRAPRTSVLGHSLFVAVLAYLFSIQLGACRKRIVNNFFTGLFHDLPEVLTRDIISPVKRSIEGLDELIREYEREMMEKEIHDLIPRDWHAELQMFTEGEFESIIHVDGRREIKTTAEISRDFNQDVFSPRDGELIKAADQLAAFIEAYVGVRNGSGSPDLHEAMWMMRNQSSHRIIGGINFEEIYADFD